MLFSKTMGERDINDRKVHQSLVSQVAGPSCWRGLTEHKRLCTLRGSGEATLLAAKFKIIR